MSSIIDPRQILKLPDKVINLIAAGEVIQRPANAIKELIENSLDAGGTDIRITVKDGGIKLLQIQDNGSGILSSELELLCQRYTTSKLRDFEDLKSIHTYGFRGEALASISQVAHVTVVTRPIANACGYRAQYEGGLLKEKPKPCGCNPGTLITAEDLFFNMTDRRRALKSATEEMKKIFDVVSKYAVHNSKVSFTLKKHGESMLDLRTTGTGGGDGGEFGSEQCSVRSAIGIVYGKALARELLQFRIGADNDDGILSTSLGFTAEGYATNPSYSNKKFGFVLFINNRLVECPPMKKSLEMLYANYGPSKSVAPFVYLKIDIAPENVDVNVHPTKQVVQFLYEREIIDALERAIKTTLDACNTSKTFVVKHFPESTAQSSPSTSQLNSSSDSLRGRRSELAKNDGGQRKVEPHSMVRTDGSERRLDEFFSTQTPPTPSQLIRVNFAEVNTSVDSSTNLLESSVESVSSVVLQKAAKGTEPPPAHITDEEIKILYDADERQAAWRPITLGTIRDLQRTVRDRSSPILRSLMANHKFVGCLDAEYALIQYQTGLYLVNTTTFTREFFYQILLFKFGNFGALKLADRCRLIDLISWAMPPTPILSPLEKRRRADELAEILTKWADMLWDYFSLQIVDGYLISIPCLHDKYVPQLEGLASYMYRLATVVKFESEIDCFETICRETSKFYAFKKKFCHGERASKFHGESIDWRVTVESVLYPAMKTKLIPPESFDDIKIVLKLSDTHDLYRVFERC